MFRNKFFFIGIVIFIVFILVYKFPTVLAYNDIFKTFQFESVKDVKLENEILNIYGSENPVLIIPVDGNAIDNNYLVINFKRSNQSSNDVVIVFDRKDVKFEQIPQKLFNLEKSNEFSKYEFYLGDIPAFEGDLAMIGLVFLGNEEIISVSDLLIRSAGFIQYIKMGWEQFWEPYEFMPWTINMIEKPKIFGKFSNFYIFWILIILIILLVSYYYFKLSDFDKRNKTFIELQKRLLTKILVVFFAFFIFFWVILDIRETWNQILLWKNFISAKDIMDNSRLGKSDFPEFLEFIKDNTKYGEKGFFLTPYPFDFEGPYHIYPDIKFDKIDKVDYIFSYGDSILRFDEEKFVYSPELKQIKYKEYVVPVENVIEFKPYAKIYKVNNKNDNT